MLDQFLKSDANLDDDARVIALRAQRGRQSGNILDYYQALLRRMKTGGWHKGMPQARALQVLPCKALTQQDYLDACVGFRLLSISDGLVVSEDYCRLNAPTEMDHTKAEKVRHGALCAPSVDALLHAKSESAPAQHPASPSPAPTQVADLLAMPDASQDLEESVRPKPETENDSSVTRPDGQGDDDIDFEDYDDDKARHRQMAPALEYDPYAPADIEIVKKFFKAQGVPWGPGGRLHFTRRGFKQGVVRESMEAMVRQYAGRWHTVKDGFACLAGIASRKRG